MIFCYLFLQIHFDTLPEDLRTVDGAKAKWLLLVMLDAMIFFLINDMPIESARRYFHQQRELCDAIMSEISFANEQLRTLLSFRNGVDSHSICVETFVQQLSYPWDNLDSFRSFHQKSTPTKAKRKFLEIVKNLSNHSAMGSFNFDLLSISNQVLFKVLASQGYFGCEDNIDIHENHFVKVNAMPSQLVEENIRRNASSLMSSCKDNATLDSLSGFSRVPTPRAFNMRGASSKLCNQRSRSSSSLTTFDTDNFVDENCSPSVHSFPSPAQHLKSHSGEVSLTSSDTRSLLTAPHCNLQKRTFRKSHSPSPLLSAYKPSRGLSKSPSSGRGRIDTGYSFRKHAMQSPVLQFQRSMTSGRMNLTPLENNGSNLGLANDNFAAHEGGKLESAQIQMDTDSEDDEIYYTDSNESNKLMNLGPNASYICANSLHSCETLPAHHFESSVSSAMDDIALNISEGTELYNDVDEADDETFHWDIAAEDFGCDSPITTTKNTLAQTQCDYDDSKELCFNYCGEENGGSVLCSQQDRTATPAKTSSSTASNFHPQQRNFVLDREMYYRAMMDMTIHESGIVHSTTSKEKHLQQQQLTSFHNQYQTVSVCKGDLFAKK